MSLYSEYCISGHQNWFLFVLYPCVSTMKRKPLCSNEWYHAIYNQRFWISTLQHSLFKYLWTLTVCSNYSYRHNNLILIIPQYWITRKNTISGWNEIQFFSKEESWKKPKTLNLFHFSFLGEVLETTRFIFNHWIPKLLEGRSEKFWYMATAIRS